MIKVRLVKDVYLPNFPKTWGLVRISDGYKEASGFKSPAEAREWAPKWGCEVVEMENGAADRICACGHNIKVHSKGKGEGGTWPCDECGCRDYAPGLGLANSAEAGVSRGAAKYGSLSLYNASHKSQGKVVVERDGDGFLVMFPNGDVTYFSSREKVEAAAKAWFQKDIGSGDIGVGRVEWRTNASPVQAFKVGDRVVAEPVPGYTEAGVVEYAGADGAVSVVHDNGGGGMYEQRMVRLANASPMQAMTLVFESDIDGRISLPVADVNTASARYREYVEKNDLGASGISFGLVVMGGKKVAEISYNGRITLENAIRKSTP